MKDLFELDKEIPDTTDRKFEEEIFSKIRSFKSTFHEINAALCMTPTILDEGKFPDILNRLSVPSEAIGVKERKESNASSRSKDNFIIFS